MNIIDELLIKNGFDTNHPDYALKKFYLHNKTGNEWRISVESVYITNSNKLSYKAFAWNTNETGVIVKRCDASFIDTVEDLQTVINLCEIPLTITE